MYESEKTKKLLDRYHSAVAAVTDDIATFSSRDEYEADRRELKVARELLAEYIASLEKKPKRKKV